MKNLVTLIAIAFIMVFVSCRKSYNCVCDTVQADGSNAKITYELKKQTHEDANDFCERYEDDLNSIKEGTTGCHL